MNWSVMVLALPCGATAGLLYFGGLWWTVCRLAQTEHPALLLASSFIIRLAATGGLFYLVLRICTPCLIPLMLGFFLGRWLLITWQGKAGCRP